MRRSIPVATLFEGLRIRSVAIIAVLGLVLSMLIVIPGATAAFAEESETLPEPSTQSEEPSDPGDQQEPEVVPTPTPEKVPEVVDPSTEKVPEATVPRPKNDTAPAPDDSPQTSGAEKAPKSITDAPVSAAGAQPKWQLPFQKGQKWRANGPHHMDGDTGTASTWGSLDFGPQPSAGNKKVVSVAAGTVYKATCGNGRGWYIGVDHGSGWKSTYYHLSNQQSGLIGKKVAAGTYLGDASNTLNCGVGYSSAPHVHLTILKDNKYTSVNGFTFGNYRVYKGAGAYLGKWTDLNGKTVISVPSSGFMTGSLTSTTVGTLKFTSAPTPKISGFPFVGSTLTAAPGTWKPAAGFKYQWKRDGKNISGATGKTYTPTLADAGTKLTLAVKGSKSGYTAVTKTSSALGPILGIDADGNGIDDSQEAMPWNSDVNGDGRPDLVGFGGKGTQVALNTGRGFGAASNWNSDFGTDSGWKAHRHPRTLVDVNGDGKSDVVGFATNGVRVGVGTGKAFAPERVWSGSFATGTWQTGKHIRTLADVNGDGLADIVGFGDGDTWVALGTGTGFGKISAWSPSFGYDDGYRVDRHPRKVVDMNADGMADLVAFSDGGVDVALSTGSGFAPRKRWASEFGYSQGWRVAAHPRTIVDVNGDGLPDVVGFASNGVRVALNTGDGLGPVQLWLKDFGTATGGWQVARNPRVLADVSGDGLPDIVGFGNSGVLVAKGTGRGFAKPAKWQTRFSYDDTWRTDKHPRAVSDFDGDGKADIIGFGSSKVLVSRSTGSAFAAQTQASTAFSYAGGWRVASHPRAVGFSSLKTQRRVFVDVPDTHKFFREIGWMHSSKLSTGVRTKAGLKYLPKDGVSREAMAAFLYRLEGADYRGPKVSPFADVKKGDRFYDEIAWMHKTGLSTGIAQKSGKPKYAPKQTVSREAMAAFIYRLEKARYSPPKVSPFADVEPGDKFYREIAWMRAQKLSTGTAQASGKPKYAPKQTVSREAMAAFLYRLEH